MIDTDAIDELRKLRMMDTSSTAEWRGAHARWLLIAAIAACVACTVLTAPAAATQDQGEGPYDLPAVYYGEVDVNDQPAPAGTVIEAEIDGEVRGSITVDERGWYGSEDDGGERLVVNGYADEEGTPVTFYVDGDGFDRTAIDTTSPENVTWESETVQRVDLTADVDTGSSPGDGITLKPTADITVDGKALEVGKPITFSAANSSFDWGSIASYEWTIDGEQYEGESVTETFDEPGKVKVELTVTADNGETDTATHTLTVEAADDPSESDDPSDDEPVTEDDGSGETVDETDGDDGSLPTSGFGVVVALAAILTTALLSYRRRD